MQAIGDRATAAQSYLKALMKDSFPNKPAFSKMVNDAKLKQQTIETMRAEQAAASRASRWFG